MRSRGVLKLGATELDKPDIFHLWPHVESKKKKRSELIVTLTLMIAKQIQMVIRSHF